MAKKSSKTFLRCARKIEMLAVEHARKQGYDAVCCGHTHLPSAAVAGASSVEYYNSGCWTERPAHYLTVHDGRVELHAFEAASGSLPVVELELAGG